MKRLDPATGLSTVIQARVPLLLADEFFRKASRKGVSISELLRAVVEEYLRPETRATSRLDRRYRRGTNGKDNRQAAKG